MALQCPAPSRLSNRRRGRLFQRSHKVLSGGSIAAMLAATSSKGPPMTRAFSLPVTLFALASSAAAQPAAKPARPTTPSEVVAAAPASAWRPIPADDLLIIDLKNGGRVVI